MCKPDLDIDGVIQAACLSFPLCSHGRGEEFLLCYPSHVQTNCYRFSISAFSQTFLWIKTKHCLHTQPEEMPCLVTASKNPELAKQTSTQTYTYTCIEHEDIVQLHWTWRHKLSILFMWQHFILLKGEEKSGNLPIPFLLTEFGIISLSFPCSN